MDVEYDEDKRRRILAERGLDFADAVEVLSGPILTRPDDRRDYGEARYLTVGFLQGRMVVLAWTWRAGRRRIISMRKANGREIARYGPAFE